MSNNTNNFDAREFQQNKLLGHRKQTIVSLESNLRTCLAANEYPGSFERFNKLNPRLRAMFGLPYCNLYSKTAMFKQFNTSEIKHGHSFININIGSNNFDFKTPFDFDLMKLVSHRNIALNQSNGWYAALLYDTESQLPYLCIFKACDSFNLRLVCYLCVSELFGQNNNGGNKDDIQSIMRMSRVRFVGDDNNIFIFVWESPSTQIWQYKVKCLNKDTQEEYVVEEFNKFFDVYIMKSHVCDMDVLLNPDLFAVLFNKGIGFYRFEKDNSKSKLVCFDVSLS